MKFIESIDKNLDIKKIQSLRDSVGWVNKRGYKKWLEVLEKSFFVYSVWDNKKLIGMGRIVEDGIMCMFYDVVVHKDYQNNGIGKMIMTKMVDEVKNKDYRSIGLFVSSENKDFLIPFYKKFEFDLSVGMEFKE